MDEIRRVRPDLTLIAGDFIYDWSQPGSDAPSDEIAEDERERTNDTREVASMLGALPAAGIPTFAVLGNHDYGMMWPTSPPLPRAADALQHAPEAHGVVVLRNQARAVGLCRAGAVATAPLYVVGIDAHLPQRDDVAAALRGVSATAARVALMHNPASFAGFPPGTAPLAVAGHSPWRSGPLAVPAAMVVDDAGPRRARAHGGSPASGPRATVCT